MTGIPCRGCGEPLGDYRAHCPFCGTSTGRPNVPPPPANSRPAVVPAAAPTASRVRAPAPVPQAALAGPWRRAAQPAITPTARLVVIAIGGVLCVVGSLMPWESLGIFSVAGTRGDGMITLLLALAGLGLLAARGAWRRRWLYAVEIVLASIALLVGAIHLGDQAAAEGILMTTAGALVWLVGSLIGLLAGGKS
jgi:hypothetical protein